MCWGSVRILWRPQPSEFLQEFSIGIWFLYELSIIQHVTVLYQFPAVEHVAVLYQFSIIEHVAVLHVNILDNHVIVILRFPYSYWADHRPKRIELWLPWLL